MIELGLDHGDLCQATYRLGVLHFPNALAIWLRRWSRRNEVDSDSPVWDEEASIEVIDGRRMCVYPPRPETLALPWWLSSSPPPRVVASYSDWLAWPGLDEVKVVTLSSKKS